MEDEDKTLDIPYPRGHNWEGLTPRQVNEAYARISKKKAEFPCSYPGCKCESTHKHNLELVNEENAGVELPFCDYHFFIVMGGHFKARMLKGQYNLLGEWKETDFEMLGPFKEIEINEQVLGAREMIAKLKSEK